MCFYASEICGAKEECFCYKHMKSTFHIILWEQKFPFSELKLGYSITKSLNLIVRYNAGGVLFSSKAVSMSIQHIF